MSSEQSSHQRLYKKLVDISNFQFHASAFLGEKVGDLATFSHLCYCCPCPVVNGTASIYTQCTHNADAEHLIFTWHWPEVLVSAKGLCARNCKL
jgi:hypothetical protein